MSSMVTRPGFPYLFAVLELWFAEGVYRGVMLVLVPLNTGGAGRRIFPPRLRRGTRHPDAPPSPRSASESVRADTLRAHPENAAAPAQRPSAERRYRPKVTSGCPKRSEGGFPVGTRTITTFPSGTQDEHRFSKRNRASPAEPSDPAFPSGN